MNILRLNGKWQFRITALFLEFSLCAAGVRAGTAALPPLTLSGSTTAVAAANAGARSVIAPVLISTAAFAGESCRRCHETLRDRKPSALHPGTPPQDAGNYDVIVVGGGISGLSAAYSLRDYKVLLLDKESRVGGKIRSETLHGRLFPAGGAYMGEPTGKIREFFRSLGLHVEHIEIPDHSLAKNGAVIDHWITTDPKLLPISPSGQTHFKTFQEFLRKIAGSNKLPIPIQESDPKMLADLDRYAFYQWLDNNYGEEVADLGDLYSRDVFGITAHEISAAVGVLYMSAETEPSYSWEGGLGPASEALDRALGPRIRTGMFVWNVSQGADGVTVDFQDGSQDWRARGRAVVIAVPSMIARRIVQGLTDAKSQALSRVRYSAYAVVPLHLDRVFYKGSFVLWTPGRFFTDLTLPILSAEALKDAKDEVLLASVPMGESEGREALLHTSDMDFTAKVLADLDTVFKGSAFGVTEARVIRWGHAMPILYPGYLTQVRPILAKPEGRYFFAGVDTQVPAIEGAIDSGVSAAEAVRRFLKTNK